MCHCPFQVETVRQFVSLFVHPDRDDVQVPSSGIFVQEDDVRLAVVTHALHELMSYVGHLSVGEVVLRCRRERKMDDRFTDVGITVGKEPESVEAVGKVDAAVRLAGKALRSQHLALACLGLQIIIGKHSVEVAAVAHGGNHRIMNYVRIDGWQFYDERSITATITLLPILNKYILSRANSSFSRYTHAADNTIARR